MLFLSLLAALVLPASAGQFYMLTLVRSLLLDSEHYFLVQLGGERSGVIRIESTCAVTAQTHRSPPHFIPEGFVSVPYRIPFKNYNGSVIRLQFHLYVCAQSRRSRAACLARPGPQVGKEATALPVEKRSLLLIADISKPIYRPREDVRFRLLALYPAQLHPSRPGLSPESRALVLDWVRLESPRGRRMAEWRKVSWRTALQGFSYSLPGDTEFGKWRVKAKCGQVKEETSFIVRRYILPRFSLSVRPPTFLRADSSNVSFSVCARHGSGRPIKAAIMATLCLVSLHNNQQQVCLNTTGRLDGSNICQKFTEDVEPLKLQDCDMRLGRFRTHLTARVTEDGTGVSLTRGKDGGELTFYPFRIRVVSPAVFRPGLPYYGRVKVLSPDDTPVPGVRIDVSFEGERSQDAFHETFTADGKGELLFQIPVIFGRAQTVNLQLQWADYQRRGGCVALRRPETFFVLRRLYSKSSTFLQALPLSPTIMENACKSGYLSLRLQSTVPLHDKHISVVGTSRGLLMSGQSFGPRRKQLCRDTDDPALGHYTCMGEKDGVTKIKCLAGWSGRNCLTPICSQGCVRGVCRSRDRCVCQRHWTGKACHRCLRRARCIHGVCRNGGDCVCQPDWTGFECNIRRNSKSPALQPLSDTVLPVVRPNASESEQEENLALFERTLELRVTPNLAPASRLAVWFLFSSSKHGKEFVTASIELSQLTKCLSRASPTSFSFSKAEVRPGQLVTANIKTSGKEALCALSITDTTLEQFAEGDELQMEVENSLRALTDALAVADPSAALERRHCGEKRPPRAPDSSHAFRSAGLLVLSSVSVVTAPCPPPGFLSSLPGALRWDRWKSLEAAEAAGQKSSGASNAKTLQKVRDRVQKGLRRFFPESWRFSLITKPTNNMTLWAPDSITTWRSRFYCVSSTGLGISPPATLVVFQPFFVQMTIPYSLIRGETARLPVQVFSYIRRCAQVDLEMTSGTQLRVSGSRHMSACLCNFNQMISHFSVSSTALGWMPVEIHATLRSSARCAGVMAVSSNGRQEPKMKPIEDAVRRSVLVEPEGIPDVFSAGDIFCVRNSTRHIRLSVQVPSGRPIVSGSERAYLTWSGDVVTGSLHRLDRLIRLPYGCGEQNMMSLVPSIYVADYLAALTNETQAKGTKELREKTKKFMKIGYDRQLNYRHKDGSFSAFGRHDKRGSTWLTAFVLKSFSKASRHININPQDLSRALTFLRRKTRSDSCFREDGRVLTPGLKGGLNQDKDEVSITAYILGALLETKLVLPTNSSLHPSIDLCVRHALKCMRHHTPIQPSSDTTAPPINPLSNLSTYTIALRAYALTRMPALAAQQARKAYVDELNLRKRRGEHGQYWPANALAPVSEKGKPWVKFTAEDVETTGYALLTAMEVASGALLGVQDGIRWLLSQRSDQGGWYSTQDTLVALQSLTRYARMTEAMTKVTNLKLNIRRADEKGSGQEFHAGPNTRLVSTRLQVAVPTSLRIQLSGTGCLTLQHHVLFNIGQEKSRSRSPFTVSVTANQRPDQCSRASLTACSSFHGNTSNMAIMRVGMASGWEVSPEDFQRLRKEMAEGGLRRAEVAADKALLLYFDQLTSERRCVRLQLSRRLEVLKLKPLIVQVYDYYRPDVIAEGRVAVLSRKCLPRRRRVVGKACPRCPKASKVLCQPKNGSVWLSAVQSGPGSVSSLARYVRQSGMFWSAELRVSQACRCRMGRATILMHEGPVKESEISEAVVLDPSWIVLPLSRVLRVPKKCIKASPDLRFAVSAAREMKREAREADAERRKASLTLDRPELACPICARHLSPAAENQLRLEAKNGTLEAFLVLEKEEKMEYGRREWFIRGRRRLLGTTEHRLVDLPTDCLDLSCSYERRPDGNKLFLLVLRDTTKMAIAPDDGPAPPIKPDGDFYIGAPRRMLALGFMSDWTEDSASKCSRCIADIEESWMETARLSYLLLRREATLLVVDGNAANRKNGAVWTIKDTAGKLVARRCVNWNPKCSHIRCDVPPDRPLTLLVQLTRTHFDAELWRGDCLTLDNRFIIGQLPNRR